MMTVTLTTMMMMMVAAAVNTLGLEGKFSSL